MFLITPRKDPRVGPSYESQPILRRVLCCKYRNAISLTAYKADRKALEYPGNGDIP